MSLGTGRTNASGVMLKIVIMYFGHGKPGRAQATGR